MRARNDVKIDFTTSQNVMTMATSAATYVECLLLSNMEDY